MRVARVGACDVRGVRNGREGRSACGRGRGGQGKRSSLELLLASLGLPRASRRDLLHSRDGIHGPTRQRVPCLRNPASWWRGLLFAPPLDMLRGLALGNAHAAPYGSLHVVAAAVCRQMKLDFAQELDLRSWRAPITMAWTGLSLCSDRMHDVVHAVLSYYGTSGGQVTNPLGRRCCCPHPSGRRTTQPCW